MVRTRFLVLALLAAALWYAKGWVEAHVEIATLHTRGPQQVHYTRLFVVDDPPVLWVRAERPDRLWLEALRSNPTVVLRRGDADVRYQALPWNGTGGHQRVDALFREKYGPFDVVSGLLWRRDAVPIRLEPL